MVTASNHTRVTVYDASQTLVYEDVYNADALAEFRRVSGIENFKDEDLPWPGPWWKTVSHQNLDRTVHLCAVAADFILSRSWSGCLKMCFSQRKKSPE